jgi:hypothetical protein
MMTMAMALAGNNDDDDTDQQRNSSIPTRLFSPFPYPSTYPLLDYNLNRELSWTINLRIIFIIIIIIHMDEIWSQ